LPPPSAELVLWRVALEVFVATRRRKEGEKFLRLMAEKLASEEPLAAGVPSSPSSQQEATRSARRQAIAFFRQMLPVWLARLPPKELSRRPFCGVQPTR